MRWSSGGRKNTKNACNIPRGTNSQSQHQSCWCSCPHRSRPRWTQREENKGWVTTEPYDLRSTSLQQMVGHQSALPDSQRNGGGSRTCPPRNRRSREAWTGNRYRRTSKQDQNFGTLKRGKIREERRKGDKLTIRCSLLFQPSIPRTMRREED